VVDWLRNRSRPYLFSNSIPPVGCGCQPASSWDLLENSPELRARNCSTNTRYFPCPALEKAGFNLKTR